MLRTQRKPCSNLPGTADSRETLSEGAMLYNVPNRWAYTLEGLLEAIEGVDVAFYCRA